MDLHILYTIYKTVYKGVSNPWTCTFCIQYTKLYTKIFRIHGLCCWHAALLHFVYNIQNCIQRCSEFMALLARSVATFCIQYTKLYTKVFQIHGPAHFVYNIQNCIQRCFESMALLAPQRCYILYTIYKLYTRTLRSVVIVPRHLFS
jgi:hypothetical protein